MCESRSLGSSGDRAERALALSPLEPYAYFYKSTLTTAHYFNGSFEESVYWGRKTLASAPRFVANMRSLIASLSALGETKEAEDVAARLIAIDPKFSVGQFCKWYPIESPEQLQKYSAHLLAAKLPE